MVLGKRIAQARIERGMTQQELADATGVSKVAIEKAEYNRKPPSASLLWAISKETGKPMEYFMVEPNDAIA